MNTCSQTALASRALDAELAQGFPASDPPSLTQPFGDARDAAGRDCSIAVKKSPNRRGRSVRRGAAAARAQTTGTDDVAEF